MALVRMALTVANSHVFEQKITLSWKMFIYSGKTILPIL